MLENTVINVTTIRTEEVEFIQNTNYKKCTIYQVIFKYLKKQKEILKFIIPHIMCLLLILSAICLYFYSNSYFLYVYKFLQ